VSAFGVIAIGGEVSYIELAGTGCAPRGRLPPALVRDGNEQETKSSLIMLVGDKGGSSGSSS
jgi:hypothetical protein